MIYLFIARILAGAASDDFQETSGYLKFSYPLHPFIIRCQEQANFEQERLRRSQQLFCAQIFLKFYVKNVTYKNLDSITLPQL